MAERDERAVIHDGIDPKAIEAARKGELPEPAPGMAGESDPSEPSRAEVLAVRPDLADSAGSTPTEGHAHATGGDEPPHVRGDRAKLEGAPPPGGQATEEHDDGV